MSHQHHNHHHHEAPQLRNINRAFFIGIGLNALFTAIEFTVGYTSNSLAIIADATHNLSDVVSLIIALLGMRLAQKSATFFFTYGYKKASILASLINSILLVIIVIKIFIEAIERISTPPPIAGNVIIITASIGVIINTVSAFLFYKGQKSDINIKGAFLHLIVDAVVSVGVVISGVIIYYTHWNIVDSLISFGIGIVILISTWSLLKESIKLVLDGVPEGIDIKQIEHILLHQPGVKEIHHLHIWALSSSQTALTVHIVMKEHVELSSYFETKKRIKHELLEADIAHATVELDQTSAECLEQTCE